MSDGVVEDDDVDEVVDDDDDVDEEGVEGDGVAEVVVHVSVVGGHEVVSEGVGVNSSSMSSSNASMPNKWHCSA